MSGGIAFYFLKTGGEFYITNSSFSLHNTDNAVWLSNIRSYHISKGNQYKGSVFIIEKKGNQFITSYKSWNELTSNNIEYYYNSNYEISKIVINSNVYVKK